MGNTLLKLNAKPTATTSIQREAEIWPNSGTAYPVFIHFLGITHFCVCSTAFSRDRITKRRRPHCLLQISNQSTQMCPKGKYELF